MALFNNTPMQPTVADLQELISSRIESVQSGKGIAAKPEKVSASKEDLVLGYFREVFNTTQEKADSVRGELAPTMEALARESALLNAQEREAAGITQSLVEGGGEAYRKKPPEGTITRPVARPDELITDTAKDVEESAPVTAETEDTGLDDDAMGLPSDAGLMSDPRKLGGAEGYGSVGTPPEADTGEGLMTRPKARPTGLRALSEPEKNKAAQKYLGITADGLWGKGSTRKLAGWQYQNGIPVSGVLDEATIKAMENPETEDPRKEVTLKSVLNTAGTAPDISKVKTWAKENIKDPMRAAAFVATVEAETGGRALVESGHTLRSAVRTFVTNNKYMHEGNDLNRPLNAKGKRRKQKLEALGTNATGDELFNYIYGPDADAIGASLGNTSATDGSTYKGRGLVQITGKDNYQRVGDIIGVDLVNNPELVKDPKYAAAAAMAYLTLPGKDFFDGTLTSGKLATAIGHTGSAATRWTRATELKGEMYP